MSKNRLLLWGLLLLGWSVMPLHASTFPFTCTLDYMVSTDSGMLSDTPVDRVCTAQIVFMDSTHSGETSREYACTVAAGTSSCTATIDPSLSGVPSSFSPTAVATAPLYSSLEESHGCTYAILDGFATPPQLYPSAQVMTMPMPMSGLQVNVIHRFDCTSRP